VSVLALLALLVLARRGEPRRAETFL